MIYFTAHTFKCVCHCIRTMFRVLGVYNFGQCIKNTDSNFSYNFAFETPPILGGAVGWIVEWTQFRWKVPVCLASIKLFMEQQFRENSALVSHAEQIWSDIVDWGSLTSASCSYPVLVQEMKWDEAIMLEFLNFKKDWKGFISSRLRKAKKMHTAKL